jgi:hypothetical protein
MQAGEERGGGERRSRQGLASQCNSAIKASAPRKDWLELSQPSVALWMSLYELLGQRIRFSFGSNQGHAQNAALAATVLSRLFISDSPFLREREV